MITPNLKKDDIEIFNKRELPLYAVRNVDKRTFLGLRLSELLLFTGFVLILLNNLGIIAPGTYFGAFSWVTAVVFSIGLAVNFVAIPYLYFSSFRNFKMEHAYWDSETFLIVPAFFFGTFFLYGSRIQSALIFLTISIIVIAIIHYEFLILSWKFLLKSSNEAFLMQKEYFLSLKYLTAYYFLLLVLLLLVNPLQMLFYWIRLYF